ncbi:MAG: hypothetical protein J6U20_10395 [Fibrobacter sp.]|nr:hypothetical protein [Fibrobacter sp.]
MKKETQNTLVYDFIGTAFCLVMAFVLILMFSGCSNDESKQPVGSLGGAEEETGIYALSGRAGDVYPKSMRLTKPSSNEGNEGIRLTAKKGVVVVIHELDSLTLDTTGLVFVDTIDNENGQFAFGKFSLNSPYTLIEIQDSCIAHDCQTRGVWGSENYRRSIPVPCNYDSLYEAWGGGSMPTSCGILDSTKHPIPLSAILDVRKHDEISINSLTYLKIPLVKKYFAEGMDFAAASKKAEQELLENFGIYEDLGDFESLESVNGELSYVLQMMAHITRTRCSNVMGFEWNLAEAMVFYYNISPATVAALGGIVEETYLNTLRMIDYEIGYFLHLKNYGTCTEARENETHNIITIPDSEKDLYFGYDNDRILRHTTDPIMASIVCRSKKWVPGWKKIDYTTGTMVDPRDGKTYKTVTYDWDGVTQTWMAENLNYADTTSTNTDSALKNNLLGNTSCWKGDSSCESFGRYYTWMAAMNLDWSSIKMTSYVHDFVIDEESDNYMDSNYISDVEEMCLAIKYDDNNFFGDTSYNIQYEYCGVKTTNNECHSTDTAASVFEYCHHRYNQSCRLDCSGFIPQSGPVAHQGVCPDGWRIPNKEDWIILTENIDRQGALFNDPIGSGFGIYEAMNVEFVNSDVPGLQITDGAFDKIIFASVPDINDAPEQRPAFMYEVYFGFQPIRYLNTFGNIDFYELNKEVNVRCIKN